MLHSDVVVYNNIDERNTMTTGTVFVRRRLEEALRATAHLILSFVISIVLFVYSSFALALSFGLTFLFGLGLLVLTGYLFSMQFIVRGEILRANYIMKTSFELPKLEVDRSESTGKRILGILSNRQLWSGVLYVFLFFPIGILGFVFISFLIRAPFVYLKAIFDVVFNIDILNFRILTDWITDFSFFERVFWINDKSWVLFSKSDDVIKFFNKEIDWGVFTLVTLPISFIAVSFIAYFVYILQRKLVQVLLCNTPSSIATGDSVVAESSK